jgi:NitT/TauT family transport system ATP-binding protein
MSDRVAVMSNRPGRIKTVVPIDLERPRRYDMVASPAFAALQHRVLDEIRAESIAIAALGDALS